MEKPYHHDWFFMNLKHRNSADSYWQHYCMPLPMERAYWRVYNEYEVRNPFSSRLLFFFSFILFFITICSGWRALSEARKANASLLVDFHELYCGLLAMYKNHPTLWVFFLKCVLQCLGFFSSPLTLLIKALFSKYKVVFSDQPVGFGFAGISGIFSAMQHLSNENKKSIEIYSAVYLAKEK